MGFTPSSVTEVGLAIVSSFFLNFPYKFLVIGKPASKCLLGIEADVLNAESLRFLIAESKTH
jgi:hypothetical protein